jgi:hypothetical protein
MVEGAGVCVCVSMHIYRESARARESRLRIEGAGV